MPDYSKFLDLLDQVVHGGSFVNSKIQVMIWCIFGIDLVIFICSNFGVMKQEEKVPYNLRLPAKLKTQLERQAREERRSLNQYIVLVLEVSARKKPKAATA